MQWDSDLIQALINDAETSGLVEIELASPREADLFRSAVNNNRRLKKIGPDLATKVQGRIVKVFRKPTIKVLNQQVA